MNEITLLQNQLEWERQAREQMEALLEKKTVALFQLKKEMEQLRTQAQQAKPVYHENRITPEFQTVNDKDKAILSQISHELKTPLNVIVGSAHLLYDTLPTEEQVEHIDIIHSAAQIIKRLVGDIQNYSKTEDLEVVLEKKAFDLPKLIKSIYQHYSFKLDKSNIEIAYYTDDRIKKKVIGDQTAFSKILKKLLDHVIDNIAAGKIFVNTILLEDQGGRQKIEVNILCQMTNNLAKMKDIIFPNHQVDLSAPRGSFHQIPLNLLHTNIILEKWDSRLNIEQVPEKGFNLSFHLTLDKSDDKIANPNPSRIPNQAANHLQELSVLIVEDNQINQRYLSGLMKKWKVEADIANNGKDALNFTQHKAYDLILMDLLMPELNGLETTVCIRNANSLNQHTPIIAITATDSKAQKKRALEAGMNDFLVKPFNPDDLLVIMSKYQESEAYQSVKAAERFISFDHQLDHIYLEQFYGKDIHFAIENFSSFMQTTLAKDLPMLKEFMQGGHWAEFTKLTQKIVLACKNVGILELEASLYQLEALAQAQPDFLLISNLLHTLEESLQSYQPIIQKELKKLQVQLSKLRPC